MKQKIASFLLFVYIKHIKEDWDVYTPLGKFFLMPAWFISSTLTWIISPIFIPQYLFVNSNIYKQFKYMNENFTPEQMVEMRRVQRENFLNRKYGRSSNSEFKNRTFKK